MPSPSSGLIALPQAPGRPRAPASSPHHGRPGPDSPGLDQWKRCQSKRIEWVSIGVTVDSVLAPLIIVICRLLAPS